MDLIYVGILGVILLLALLAVGVPIAFAMAFTGVIGLWIVEGPAPTMAHAALIPWEHGRDFIFVAVPLFVLMGQLFYHAGLASDLYGSANGSGAFRVEWQSPRCSHVVDSEP